MIPNNEPNSIIYDSSEGLYYPRFPDSWQKVSLHSLAKWINGRAFKKLDFDKSGLPVIKIAEIKNGISSQTNFTNKRFDTNIFVKRGDILFSWSGTPETSIDIFLWNNFEGWLNQHTFRIEPVKGINKRFFFYLLKYLKNNFIKIASNKKTTGLGHVTMHDLENLIVSIPQESYQKKIASILSSFDDKIELNNKISKILEEMAEEIFKEWFINFRIPGYERIKFDDSMDGKIPEGWISTKLGNMMEFHYGKALKEEERKKGIILVIGSSGIVGTHNEKLVNGPGIVVGRKGNVGSILWIDEDFYPIDTTFYIKSELSLYFCYLLLLKQRFITGDSAVPGLNRDQAYMNKLILPNKEIINKFEKLIKPLFDKRALIVKENQKLSSLRDLLLPKLMKGEIKVL